MKIFSCVWICIFCISFSQFASGQITFQKAFDLGPGYERATSIVQVADGGFIFSGPTNQFGTTGGQDSYVVKTNAFGDTVWTRYLRHQGDNGLLGSILTSDSNYVACGMMMFTDTTAQVLYLIKMNLNGDTVFAKAYGDTISINWGYCIQQTSDSGFVLCGSTNYPGAGNGKIYLMKTDANGNLLWDKSYGDPFPNVANSLQQTNDGGFIIAGRSFPNGCCLLKTDVNGNVNWFKTYQGNDFYSVRQTPDNGFIMCGRADSFGAGSLDGYVVKTDSLGNLQWTKTFGGSSIDAINDVCLTFDGGFLFVGGTWSFGAGGSDVYVIKTDASGDTLWTKTYGGLGNDNGAAVKQTSDGGYIIAGSTSSFRSDPYDDSYIIKLDSLGNSGCFEGETQSIITNPIIQVMQPTIPEFSGNALVFSIDSTYVTSGCAVMPDCITLSSKDAALNNPFIVYPNPTSGKLRISSSELLINIVRIKILDFIGKELFTEIVLQNKIEMDIRFLSKGIYFLEVQTEKGSIVKRFIKE